jgi:hypothetical protein
VDPQRAVLINESTNHDLRSRARLFTPGERLGWVFRDRWQFAQPFDEPAPARQQIPLSIVHAANHAQAAHHHRTVTTYAICSGLFGLTTLVSYGLILAGSMTIALWALGTSGIVLIGLVFGMVTMSSRACSAANSKADQAQRHSDKEFDQRIQQWRVRKLEHELVETNRVDRLPEWGSVSVPADIHRFDVFGGNLWSWQAFLTVHGASVLVRRPVIVVDLSREMVSDELVTMARAAGVPVDVQVLPDELATTTLLAGLPPRQLVDVLIESMYGEAGHTTRADRSMDDRILMTLCEALGKQISLGRIAAGLRALLDEPDTSAYLTRDERTYIADELFSGEYRRRAADALRRIEAYIQPLEALGTQTVVAAPGYLTCMALASEARNVRSELLTDLIIQWLTHRLVAGYTVTPDVIIAGADAIAVRNLERLTDVCERRNIRLTLLIRHLRQTGLDVIGGGAVGFMKIGNNVEASRAADFIGRGHTFVLSQLSTAVGGNESHTMTDSDGVSESDGINVSVAAGWTENWTKGNSTSHDSSEFFSGNGTTSKSKSLSRSSSQTHTGGSTWSTARNWSASRAYAEGINWSDTSTHQRVYEYAVEPTDLQHLPDHAMLLVHSRPGGKRRIQPVEFDPAIVTLPRVSTTPFSSSTNDTTIVDRPTAANVTRHRRNGHVSLASGRAQRFHGDLVTGVLRGPDSERNAQLRR